jgi:hypothetical protein
MSNTSSIRSGPFPRDRSLDEHVSHSAPVPNEPSVRHPDAEARDPVAGGDSTPVSELTFFTLAVYLIPPSQTLSSDSGSPQSGEVAFSCCLPHATTLILCFKVPLDSVQGPIRFDEQDVIALLTGRAIPIVGAGGGPDSAVVS